MLRTSPHFARLAVALLAAASVLAPARAPRAQTLVRRPPAAGEVSGLELSLEGATRVVRGGRARWLLTVHEVVGLSDLRPAARVRVRLLTPLDRERPAAEATTDALGRAELALEVPEDAPGSLHLLFEAASSARNVRRQFDLDVGVDPARRVALELDRTRVRLGGTVHLWGRVVSAVTGAPVPAAPVTLEVQDAHQRAAAPRVRLVADAAGGFRHDVRVTDAEPGRYTVIARTGAAPELESRASVGFESAPLPPAPAMIVRLAPARAVVGPDESVTVDVVVRTGDGRPVRGAVLSGPYIPAPSRASREPPLRTDARGRARFTVRASNIGGGTVDVPIAVSAARAGVGAADASTSVRVAAAQLFAAVAVEGAALIPGLPGRVYVRVVGPDGAPARAGVAVALSGPRLPAGLTATTDADGAVAIETPALLARAPATVRRAAPGAASAEQSGGQSEGAAADACGGGTATSFTVALSRGAERGAATGCLPIDPDGTVRVRLAAPEGAPVRSALRPPTSPVVAAGAPARVALLRAPGVAGLPIELALLARRGDALVPLTATVVPPGQPEASIPVPPDAAGPLVLRARPLHGAVALALRGGVAAVWAAPAPGARFALTAQGEPGGTAVGLAAAAPPGEPAASAVPLVGTLVVLPREEGDALLARIRARDEAAAALGDLRVSPGRAGDALLAGALCARTALDDAAPAALREGLVVPLPAPESPALRGTLRDPWRARARFVEGRLALVFRQIEDHVARTVRAARESVAVREAGGWRFNREIFDAILSQIDPAAGGTSGEMPTTGGPRSLSGAPLTIDVLRRLDPAFTFDNVARRITRRRMFTLLVALRRFVNAHALDLRWSWRGDPSTWLRSIAAEGSITDPSGAAIELDADALVDGWGTPFVLRPAPGGRARFGFVAPVPGYELVSAGPDERVGSGDDVRDPFVRVLPAGGAYARAVAEDALMARLRGVELGRATVNRLAGVFAVPAGDYVGDPSGGGGGAGGRADWSALPAQIEPDPHALDLVRPAVWAEARVRPLAGLAVGGELRVPVAVDDEPRTYAAVVDAWGARGGAASAVAHFSAGSPVLIDLPLAGPPDAPRRVAPRVRAGEPIRVAATITNLSDAPRTFRLDARGEGPLTVQAPAAVRVPAGELATVELVVAARSTGPGAVRLVVRDEQGAVARAVSAALLADDGALPVRDDAAALARPDAPAELALRPVGPTGSLGAARLVVTAPGALADDPELDRVRRLDPALIAWAYTLASRPLPPPLAAALLRAQSPAGSLRVARPWLDLDGGGDVVGAAPALSTACAIVAWSAAGEDDREAAVARERAARALPSVRGTLADPGGAGALREDAAVLAALATGAAGVSDPGSGDEGDDDDEAAAADRDPVAAHAERLRAALREAATRWPTQPTLLARAAAGLLLTDPADARGVVLFDMARRAVEPLVRGDRDGPVRVRGGEGRTSPEEELVAAAALAVAAQQRGEVALAARLGRTVAERAHVAMRLGGEAAFWVLAAASYGVYGLATPAAVTVSVAGGPARRVALVDGRAVVPLGVPAAGPALRARVGLEPASGRGQPDEGATAFARLELLRTQPYAARADAPLALSLAGDPGYTGELSALELTVRNTGAASLGRAVVEVQLPAGAALDDAARAAIGSRGAVAAAELRPGGVLRVVLRPLGGGQSAVLPLAVRWLARGRVSGFGATAYVEDAPARLSMLAPRAVELRERPDEE